MSFLLDALGKADDDRRRAEVPELRTYNQSHGFALGGVARGFILLCLLLGFFALGYFLRPYMETSWFARSGPGQDVPTVQSLEHAPDQIVAKPSGTLSPEKKIAPETPIRTYALEVISYSDSPGERFVMINCEVVHEGGRLITGETLLSISPDAVVLESAGDQFRVGL